MTEERSSTSMPRIGDIAPNFKAITTKGSITGLDPQSTYSVTDSRQAWCRASS